MQHVMAAIAQTEITLGVMGLVPVLPLDEVVDLKGTAAVGLGPPTDSAGTVECDPIM